MCAVYALFGVVLIPISFLAIRLVARASSTRSCSRRTARRWTDSQFLTFCVCLARDARSCSRRSTSSSSRASASTRASRELREIASLSVTPYREVHRRRVPGRLRGGARLRADHRVEAAAARARGRRARRARAGAQATMVELLFWPALIGYGEAAVAYSSPRYTRLGDVGRAASAGSRRPRCSPCRRRAPTASRGRRWAGSLNLFVWLVVGAYLIWGCRPRYRLLGLAVMPLAAVLFARRRARRRHGGRRATRTTANLFLVLHVGFVLAAFAGFTLAAALAALYLLGGAAAEAARGRHPAPAAAVARDARARHLAGRSRSRCRCSRSGSRSGIVRLLEQRRQRSTR